LPFVNGISSLESEALSGNVKRSACVFLYSDGIPIRSGPDSGPDFHPKEAMSSHGQSEKLILPLPAAKPLFF
jgi:hypothetical protein